MKTLDSSFNLRSAFENPACTREIANIISVAFSTLTEHATNNSIILLSG